MSTDLHAIKMVVRNKWNSILSQLLYSYTLISESCFNIGPGILQALLQPGNKQLFYFRSQEEERRSIPDLLGFQFPCSCFWSTQFPFGPTPHNKSHEIHSVGPPRPNHWRGKPFWRHIRTVLKTHTNTKRKTWCCSVMRDLQFFNNAPVTNNVKHETNQHTQITVI
jgi:hypothetical protein